ncbi:MAG: energy transducer TonB [Hydrogenophilales bacterium RIFOXYD1_FULL_62_11]|nr:MAG: energy transducer TonB [Hydrogenophilales bacterium RIFOXYD1_FULL_62_11]
MSRASLASVALVHAAVLAALLFTATAVPKPVTPSRPLTVSLIVPEIETPQPKPVVKPLTPPPVLAIRRPLPTAHAVEATPEPTPQPEPVRELPPQPAPEVTVAPKAAPAPPPPPSPPRTADYLNNPKPPYPALSRRLGEEGTVRLSILVNADGSVARLELVKSSGHPRLDQSAMNTVQSSWKFEPARQGDTPVAGWVTVPIQFTLRS